MSLKKYAVFLAALIMMMLFTSAYADDEPAAYTMKEPYYSVEGVYDADSQTYTAKVFLKTNVYLSAGTFAVAYDEGLNPTWEINTANFAQFDFENMAKFDLSEANYKVIFWGTNDLTEVTGTLELGTLTFANVEADRTGAPKDWNMQTIRLLNWNDTPMSQDEMFTNTDEGLDYNAEIWRDITEDEKTALSDANAPNIPAGYYRGWNETQDENAAWVDIDFVFTSDPELIDTKIDIKGSVISYNPTNPLTVKLYKAGEETELDTSEITTYTDPDAKERVSCDYIFTVTEYGDYTLVFEKDTHLTYTKTITISENAAGDSGSGEGGSGDSGSGESGSGEGGSGDSGSGESGSGESGSGEGDTDDGSVAVDEIMLYCGDISKDEKIKLDDRTLLLNYITRQLYSGTEELSKRCDLNGDGKVNLLDLNIFKLYYNESYTEVV